MMGHLQRDECKCLERLLERALVDEGGRVGYAVMEVVVLRRKDERCEPEVWENPGNRGKISLVPLGGREDERWEID